MAHEQPPQRPPAPSLFIGPPAQQTTAANIQQTPARQAGPAYDAPSGTPTDSIADRRAFTDAVAKRNVESHPQPHREVAGTKSILNATNHQATQESRTEAAWAEMQNTLEEVELGAAGGANAFGAEHARALEDLRKAQIALAQAWTRSEVDDEADDRADGGGRLGEGPGTGDDKSETGKMSAGSVLNNRRRGQDGPEPSSTDKGGDKKTRPRAGTSTSAGATSLEEETEKDIGLARKRRQANDEYFEKVNRGVVDVVEKLELVAQKLKDVETEAQEIWDEDSPDSD